MLLVAEAEVVMAVQAEILHLEHFLLQDNNNSSSNQSMVL